ncbi:NTP transferase domain-containing protein [Parvularcula sp. ZS-1/3]|uniref:NTP transferase domain-containing protein n=1 Tax=Parvularcula mediterranea TaxID=2732508 RepID=A0A7Y3W6P2_9PROT|nr:sugar phosphate nucleotidyltransferase [Parvularcula mediterranea]NNU17572.1 NTP transferase domain-containing protein [Parvularcula mediterranea]
MAKITPVIMAGGSGTRLWPLSRKSQPKQFQPIVSEETMLAETLARVTGDEYTAPAVIGSVPHRAMIEEALPAGAPVVLEPFGKNTAPAAICAALLVAERDAEGLVLLLPADHHIADIPAFTEAVSRGVEAAEKGYLVTLGITPEGPETGYGYIKGGEKLTGGTFKVERFVEKPDRPTAEGYLAEGGYSWNAGIFLYRASDLLAEAEKLVPDMLAKTRAAYDAGPRDGATLTLPEDLFAEVPSDSIDYAIMEATDKAAVVSPVTIGWNDIGSWSAVKDFADPMVSEGSIAIDCENTLIRASGDAPMVAAVGLKDMVVVSTPDAVLILPSERSQDVKSIVEALKAAKRGELL